MNIVIIGIIAWILLQLLIGVVVSRRVTTEADYLVAGRRLGFGIATFSIFATWFGAETCIGSAGAVYEGGLSRGSSDPFGYAVCLLLMGFVFAVPLWRRKLTTLADLFRERYSVNVERLAVVMMVPTSILWAAAQVRAFGQVLTTASGLEVSMTIAIATGVVILYTAFGGLMADAVTDFVQGISLAVGLIIILFAVLYELGGAGPALASIEPGRLRFFGEAGRPLLDGIEAWAVPICGSVVAQELVARVIATRTPGIARRACLTGAGIYLVLGLIPVFIGLVGTRLIPGLADPETILPMVARHLLPDLLYAVFAGALLSAILSTVDSCLLSAAALTSHNLIVPLFPRMPETRKVRIARWGVVIFGLVAYVLATRATSVLALVEDASAFGSAGIFVVVLMGLFTRTGGARAATVSLVSGMAVWIVGNYIYTGIILIWPRCWRPQSGIWRRRSSSRDPIRHSSLPGCRCPKRWRAISRDETTMTCALCGAESRRAELAEASWLVPEVLEKLSRRNPRWKRETGACPACVEETLLATLMERCASHLPRPAPGEWVLDSESEFGILPTPLKLQSDPRVTGRGVTLALVDSGFHPHPDLTQPKNRILAWADASADPVRSRFFGSTRAFRWPGSAGTHGSKWHGLMTSAVAAGNGRLSHGLYRGLASGANLILVQVRRPDGHIGDAEIARALAWLRVEGPALGLAVVNLSVAGDPIPAGQPDVVDREVTALVDSGVTVIAASGNDGIRRLVAPASSPAALTIGGLDDRNNFDHKDDELWHSNFGQVADGRGKPELVAPSIWVVAPLLPGTDKSKEAAGLFARRHENDPAVEARITSQKYISPHYHHVDGTSVAAPLVASVVACMLEANPALTPAQVRRVLTASARLVPSAPRERQGAGAVNAGQAVAMARRENPRTGVEMSPHVTTDSVTFILHDSDARQVRIHGSWDGWRAAGTPARLMGPGLWRAELPMPPPGRHTYKFLLDQKRWLADPDNPNKEPDGAGGLNSILIV